MDNTIIFSGKSEFYDRARPSYPKETIDFLYTRLGFCDKSTIADIGSGTGKLTELLLDRGSEVFAVEPNLDMRKKAEERFCHKDNYHSVNAAAEMTSLGDNSVDFITVAQAFHWFDHKKFRVECDRILKKNGKIVLIWNRKDEMQDVAKAIVEIEKKYCDLSLNVRRKHVDILPAIADFFKNDFRIDLFENNIKYDLDSFITLSLSKSYSPLQSNDNYSLFVNEIRAIFEKYQINGFITIQNTTYIYY